MATIAKLITDLAKKGGIDITDPKYAAVLSSAMEVPDELATQLDSAFMTLDIAKKHPEVKAHYDAQIFNGMDAKIKSIMPEYELSPEDIAAIEGEKNSYEKMKLLNKGIKNAAEKKFGELNGADKKALADQIKQLNADILKERETSQGAISAAQKQAEEDILNYAFESHLAGKNYANKDLPSDVSVSVAKTLIQSELAKKGATIVRKDGKLVLVNTQTPDVAYIENNKEVNFSDLADSILANNKLTAVSGSPGTGQQRQYHQPNINTDPNKKQPDNSKVLNAINSQLQAFGVQGQA